MNTVVSTTFAIVKEIVELERASKITEARLKDKRKELAALVNRKVGSLTEKEHEIFESFKLEVPEVASVTIYKSNNTHPDWAYIEKKLSPQELRYAKKISYFSAMKLFPV